MKNKKEVIASLDKYGIPYRPGNAPKGDSLEELQSKLTEWLDKNAALQGICYNKTHAQALLEQWGHPPPLMTPPYHPELQPIEELWRDAKQFTAREFAGTRDMPALNKHIREGFNIYGTAAHCANKVKRAREHERRFREEGVYGEAVDVRPFASIEIQKKALADDLPDSPMYDIVVDKKSTAQIWPRSILLPVGDGVVASEVEEWEETDEEVGDEEEEQEDEEGSDVLSEDEVADEGDM
jgi:transposase